jgi:hypothetical protein
MEEPECAAYMRHQYSHDGIDIIGYDAASVTCLMPCDFDDLTDFLKDIQQRFGYEADFTFTKKTGQATLVFAKQKDPRDEQHSWVVDAGLVVIVVAVLVALAALLWPHAALGASNAVNTTGTAA